MPLAHNEGARNEGITGSDQQTMMTMTTKLQTSRVTAPKIKNQRRIVPTYMNPSTPYLLRTYGTRLRQYGRQVRTLCNGIYRAFYVLQVYTHSSKRMRSVRQQLTAHASLSYTPERHPHIEVVRYLFLTGACNHNQTVF